MGHWREFDGGELLLMGSLVHFNYSELNLKGAKGLESVQGSVVLRGPGRQNSGSETVQYYNTLDAGLLCCNL